MNFINPVIDGFEAIIARISENITGKPLPAYSNLDTIIPLTEDDIIRNPELSDPYIITTTKCDLITVFDLQGVYQIVGKDRFADMVQNLKTRMTPYTIRTGQSFWISYEQDPDRAYDELALIAAPQLAAAKRMGLDVEDIILGRLKKNAAKSHFEQNIIVVCTQLDAIPAHQHREELREKVKEAKGKQSPEFGQNLTTIYESVRNIHETLINRFTEDFRLCDPEGSGILIRQLSAPEAFKRLRMMVNREHTAQNYRPQLANKQIWPHGNLKHIDALLPYKLKWQLCADNVEILNNTPYISTGELIHGNLQMDVGPLEEQQFSQLLANIDRTQPFRATFCLRPKGLDNFKFREFMSAIMSFMGDAKRANQSIKNLRGIEKNTPVMGMQATFSTWAPDLKTLKRRVSALDSALSSWGVCEIGKAHGDPILHWTATVPALGPQNPAPIMTPPLDSALYMMPLERPAAAFSDSGWCIARTPDGKIAPIHMYPAIQDSWLEVISGTPGSGKSLWLNVLNFHFIVAPGYTRIPLGCILDVGPSSAGLIALLRDNLPEYRKHEVQSIRLLNSSEYTTNIFDLQLGLRHPLPSELDFQADFLTLLCCNPRDGIAPQAISGLMNKLIVLAYKHLSTGSGQVIYEPDMDLTIDTCLRESGLFGSKPEKWWDRTTWYEIVDLLFAAGFTKEAAIAHRYAVPTLSTLSQMVAQPEIKSGYENVGVDNGENILDYVIRCFSDAAAKYPLLSGYTQFELSSETRVVSIDYSAVIGSNSPEGQLKTAIFCMLSRYIGAKNFFLEEKTFMPLCPELYKNHHLKRIKDTQSEKKMIAADETHNFKDIEIIQASFKKDSLEGRKLGIRVALSSQFLRHQNPDVLSAATTIYVMRGGDKSDADILRDQFNLSEEAIQRLDRDCKGPTSNGSNFLAIYKTKLGNIVQILNNSASATELWAFNTNQLDMTLRDELTTRFGSMSARYSLVKKFPSGTAMPLLEKMRNETRHEQLDAKIADMAVVQRLIEDLSQEIREEQIHA
ncbi:conjugal transfer protein TraU [Yersinia aldovae]|uniref:conjugal transfer protein TraU n=1 Tax=Yersinia aldovae TaxID=29483 RepID=UPI00119FB4DB|nr:conjugal transfer protein TraU [Yersinia aldovae]